MAVETLEFEWLVEHPSDCPCKECADELVREGSKPIVTIPELVLKATCQPLWEKFKLCGIYD